MPSLTDVRRQAVTGLVPPQTNEAVIREVWPSVAAIPSAAGLGRVLMNSRIGAPLAWLLLAPLYFKKVLPFLATRYWLTNRRVMMMRGLKARPVAETALADIDEVRVVNDANSDFYRSANLEIISKGKVVLTLKGVPGPESFRHAIINAVKAWVPGKASGPFLPAKGEAKK